MREPEALDPLLDEVRLTWHALVRTAEALHADEVVTPGMRGVLERVEREGPATVPDIARSRGVTRQHVQILVNGLVERGLAAVGPNPDHRRSGLVALTELGEATIARMTQRERAFLGELPLEIEPEELSRAAAVLRAVRGALS